MMSTSCRKFSFMSLLSLGQSDMFHLQLLCTTGETVHLPGNFLDQLKTSSRKLILQKRGQRQALKKGGPFSYLQVGFRKHNCGNVLIAVLLLRDTFCEAKHTTNWRVLLPATKLLLELVFHFKRNSEKPTFGRISNQSLPYPCVLNFLKKCLLYHFKQHNFLLTVVIQQISLQHRGFLGGGNVQHCTL